MTKNQKYGTKLEQQIAEISALMAALDVDSLRTASKKIVNRYGVRRLKKILDTIRNNQPHVWRMYVDGVVLPDYVADGWTPIHQGDGSKLMAITL